MLLRTDRRSPLVLSALLLAIVLQTLHFHLYYEQPAGRAFTWAVVDWTVWFVVIGLLHATVRQWIPGGARRVAVIALIVALAVLMQIMLSTGGFRLIYPASRPFWNDILHLVDKRWLQGLFCALLLWAFFSLLWPTRTSRVVTNEATHPGRSRRLRVSDGQVVHWLDPAAILYLQSARNYVFLQLADRRILVREPLTALARRLPEGRFVQISRSCLVQRSRISRIEPYSRYSKRVVLENGATLPVGRRHLADVKAVLGLR